MKTRKALIVVAAALASCRSVTAPPGDYSSAIGREVVRLDLAPAEFAKPVPSDGAAVLERLSVKQTSASLIVSGRIDSKLPLTLRPDIDHLADEASVALIVSFSQEEQYWTWIGSFYQWGDFYHREPRVFRIALDDVLVGNATDEVAANGHEFSIGIPWSIIGGRRSAVGSVSIAAQGAEPNYLASYRFPIGAATSRAPSRSSDRSSRDNGILWSARSYASEFLGVG